MSEANYDKNLRHLCTTIFAQLVDMNNRVAQIQEDKEMPDSDKQALTNYGNHHTLVLAILLNDIKEFARKEFPGENEKKIMDWAALHYSHNLKNKAFKPCQCEECPQPEPDPEQEKKDQEILDDK